MGALMAARGVGRSRAVLVVVVGLLAAILLPAGRTAVAADIVKQPVAFAVLNPLKPLHRPYKISGFLMRPAGCTRGVLLALHGLSYGQWAWDFPLRPETYSVARALALRGYATIAIDRLGYGRSDHPNGYTLTVESYAAMAKQIIKQIRAGTYGGPAFGKVGLLGHSAGSEIAELTTGLYPQYVDSLIATAYTHVPFVNNEWLQREWSQDNFRATQDDYEYFETDPQTRAADLYNLANADADVVARDNAMANLTPSGEVLSIGAQPSRAVIPTITKPVLLLLAEKDTLFPGAGGSGEMRHFASAADKTLRVVPDAGHTFMLHRNAAIGNDMIADWLDAHQAAAPRC